MSAPKRHSQQEKRGEGCQRLAAHDESGLKGRTSSSDASFVEIRLGALCPNASLTSLLSSGCMLPWRPASPVVVPAIDASAAYLPPALFATLFRAYSPGSLSPRFAQTAFPALAGPTCSVRMKMGFQRCLELSIVREEWDRCAQMKLVCGFIVCSSESGADRLLQTLRSCEGASGLRRICRKTRKTHGKR